MTSTNTVIWRDRLLELSKKLSDGRIIYVQAPAGFGKTVFAEQWLADRKERATGIALDECDNTVEDLCRKLKILLEDLYSGEKEFPVQAFVRHPDFDKAPVEFLMRAAAEMPTDCLTGIVIDDLHYLTNRRGQKVLQHFLMRLPKNIKICMLSRNAPPEVFSGMILKNEFKFITKEQMLFNSGEVYDLYKNKNLAISRRQAERVISFTEGWPIGVNALLMSEKQIPTQIMPHEWLESFLKTQVWGMWDEHLQEFMIGTCLEDVLSESLCNALTGGSDSGIILERLLTEGAFISRMNNGTYKFYRLFRDFLRKLFFSRPEAYRVKQIRTAGKWYLGQNEFLQAVERFHYIKDYEQIANCFDLLEQVGRTEFDTEQVMRAVRDTLDEEIAGRYPYLYFMMAFTARNEGRIEDFIKYAEQYYANYPRIVERNPELNHNIFFMYMMDFRFSLKDIAKLALQMGGGSTFKGVRGSATLYFPFYHRSYKEFSELLAGNIDNEADELSRLLGPLLGEEFAMLKDCILAGLYYEKGNLSHAQGLALLSVSKLDNSFVPESRFCVLALMLMIYHAMEQQEQEESIQKDIQDMIDNEKAYYLQFNFDSLLSRNRLETGDTAAARNWLETEAIDIYERLDFFRLYGHFTTARAYITLGNYDQAIILLNKILEMCRIMNRPVDTMEAEILLAIAFWKKKRGNQKKALLYLEEAINSAQCLGCRQVFINEGAELESMLSVLKNRTMRSDYTGALSEVFVKQLYFGAAIQACHSKGLTGGRSGHDIQFTVQQKRVMKLMCEGYSYRKIAETMGIQFSTVRSHIELIYRKLDACSMKDAVLRINQLDILTDID